MKHLQVFIYLLLSLISALPRSNQRLVDLFNGIREKRRYKCYPLTFYQINNQYNAVKTGKSYPVISDNQVNALLTPNSNWNPSKIPLYKDIINKLRYNITHLRNGNNANIILKLKNFIAKRLNLTSPGVLGRSVKRSGECFEVGSIDIETKKRNLCRHCIERTILPANKYPHYVEETICRDANKKRIFDNTMPCLAGFGGCKQTYKDITVLEKTGTCTQLGNTGVYVDKWIATTQRVGTSCHCQVIPNSIVDVFVP